MDVVWGFFRGDSLPGKYSVSDGCDGVSDHGAVVQGDFGLRGRPGIEAKPLGGLNDGWEFFGDAKDA
ncbi:hypothetical protein ATY48_01155 [Xanthomonas oryzae pv. oryzae]|nr:hypothetical protein AZ54_23765 [Xanthomonas oryzae pv. oryzae PXO86]ALZ73788.1 hypothetical protein APZ20_22305 [Xanthomonas oryzae pv. oryzae]AOS08411.1 hypothetical protein ATY43_23255 [Xanthomonas oryzae pv. oryzae]AOS12595.1 hypothetical protein ATY44_22475 [Xanthomonas oryzae pv. oryzae]AOS16775.1 hypothetical protein ATY45_22135 [Xanthomonas oryzae pv. oryzae]